MLKNNLIFYLCTVCLLVACSNSPFNQTQLKHTLDFAGTNCAELEKVLIHCKHDSLKSYRGLPKIYGSCVITANYLIV